MFHPDYPEVKKWTKQTWLEKGSNEKLLQHCLDSYGDIHMRATHGHSGGNTVDLSLHDNVEIPYNWSDYIHHADSSHDCNSIIR